MIDILGTIFFSSFALMIVAPIVTIIWQILTKSENRNWANVATAFFLPFLTMIVSWVLALVIAAT